MVVISNAFTPAMLKNSSDIAFRKISPKEARRLINTNFCTSIVGHPTTAKFFSTLLGKEIPTRRVNYRFGEKDILVVGTFPNRLPEGKILSEKEVKIFPITWWQIEHSLEGERK